MTPLDIIDAYIKMYATGTEDPATDIRAANAQGRVQAATWLRQRIAQVKQPPDLIAILRQAEWACFIESASDDCCPWCKAARGRGTADSHEHTCPVAPILYPKEQG